MAPKIEDAPDKWRLKIARSTAGPEWAWIPDNGGYIVHPVPAPPSARLDNNSKINEGGSNQKLILFNLGKAISGAPINTGTNQFPNPPINTGITIKNNINSACAVTNTLYSWLFPNKNWFPGVDNSNLITIDNKVLTTPANVPNNKYKFPMSLWLVENSHRLINSWVCDTFTFE